MFKIKRILITLAIIGVVVSSTVALWPRTNIKASGTIGVSLSTNAPPQFDVVSISDIPAYGVIEPSGCGEFKGKVKIRIDCFLTTESPYYSQYGGAYVVDTTSPEYLEGYKGKIDEKTGEPLNWDDYNHWWDNLPTIWQNNPFHSHFVYYDTSVLDDTIKSKIAEVTEYFYAFHTYCWDNELTFLSQWVKVPKQAGTIRDVFIAGDSSPPNKTACEDKATDILTRLPDFDTRAFEENPSPEPPLNIGEKGTITIGNPAITSGSYEGLMNTIVDRTTGCSGDGTIDTVQVWLLYNDAHNCEAATFYIVSGENLSTRDYEALGTITYGSMQEATGLSIDALANDHIGMYSTDGYIARNSTAGYSHWESNDDRIPCTDYTFNVDANYRKISLYGTGTESGGGVDIGNAPESENLGTLEVNTTYYAYGSTPSNPVEDGECTFTVTNNGDACDLDMKISDFTGGVGWNIAASSPGADEVTVTAYYSGQNPASGLVLANTDAEFYDGLASSATIKWDFSLLTGSSFGDGAEKSATLTITAVAED